ncbi:hypothetical protein E6R61_25070 [Streptomyces sp. LRa12]|nr:hypothetical protein E6R61_25070 [Streptomyces sp. LRa12]
MRRRKSRRKPDQSAGPARVRRPRGPPRAAETVRDHPAALTSAAPPFPGGPLLFAGRLRGGAGPGRTAGRLGAQEGAQDGVGVVGHVDSSFLVRVSGSRGTGGRAGPARSAAQNHGTGAAGEDGGPIGTSVEPQASPAARHEGRRNGPDHDGLPPGSPRTPQDGVEMVVLPRRADRCGHRRDRCRPDRRVRARHEQDEQQDQAPQTGVAADGGVRGGSHLSRVPARRTPSIAPGT